MSTPCRYANLLMAITCASVALGQTTASQMPGIHSTIPSERRIAAVARLEALLEKRATSTNGFKEAAKRLRLEALIYEPIGAGTVRVLKTGKVKTESLWGIMPLFAPDAKVSALLANCLRSKKEIFGIDPDDPVLLVNVESPKLESSLAGLAKLINQAPKG